MRIYLFDPGTGIYQGDDFTDEPFFLGDPPPFPDGVTTVAPPPAEAGRVPCFDVIAGRWIMKPRPPANGRRPHSEERVLIAVTNDD
ncbi:hypothetical protein GMSM_00960 [Geomonas sp. Red276]